MADRPMRRHLIETNHGHMHVTTAGEGNGTPFVLLSPGLSASRIYEPLAMQLPDRWLVMPDRLGFGHSDRLSEPISFGEYAASTLEALTALGIEQFDAFGIHTGSVEAIELAVSHPDRVRRIAVVEVPAFSEEEIEEFKSHYVSHREPAADGSHLDWYWRWWFVGGYDGGAPRPRTYTPELTQRWALEHLAALPDFWWAYHATIEHPTRELAPRVTQPFLVFSTHDDLTEQTMRAIPTLPPQATVVDLPQLADVLAFFAWLPGDTEIVIGHLLPFLDA